MTEVFSFKRQNRFCSADYQSLLIEKDKTINQTRNLKERKDDEKSFSFSLLLVTLFSLLGMTTNASAEENGEFRVGMEAGYAPFNWSQKNDAHGAVPIQGNSYAGGYDVQISKNCRWFRS